MENSPQEKRIFVTLASDISATPKQVQVAVRLLDEGNTVPFIARYRKEMTECLNDTQLRVLETRLQYLRELECRRESIISSIREQGRMTAMLEAQLMEAETKQRLEDLYLPYRPKRRTRAALAREAGLEPLAHLLFDHPELKPTTEALAFVNLEKGVENVKAALDGARNILVEELSETSDLLNSLRQWLWRTGCIVSRVVEGKESDGAKFRDYFEYREPVSRIPSHRALAIFRGRSEGFLTVSLESDDKEKSAEDQIALFIGISSACRPADDWLMQCCRWAWRVKLSSALENDIFDRLREVSEAEAINIFGTNLRDLLLASPAGHKTVLGLDPGIRTGVKLAVIDKTGKVLETGVILPFRSGSNSEGYEHAITILVRLIRRYGVELVSIGNGTASRETVALVDDLQKRYPEMIFNKVVVSEAGASVYSASELAAQEFPDMDVSYRGAVSIARRLQDPLAELVKIDPKAIGVGQYQHDVNQLQLMQRLDAVVEDCVNAVGVDVNTASSALLSRVAGLTPSRAEAIVKFRDENGAFKTRLSLLNVPRLGAKTFEQAVGFLRISGGINPLDASAVHPEAYPVVHRIVEKTGLSISELIGNKGVLRHLNVQEFIDEQFGAPTVKDILKELEKPGRDPRPEFKTATFAEGIHAITDLKPDMELEGVVTNVAAFGAFVDVGVHQDGLVHISRLANYRVDDPRKVVRVGDIVKVIVLDVDVERKRISLSMQKRDTQENVQVAKDRRNHKPRDRSKDPSLGMSALANAFAKLRH